MKLESLNLPDLQKVRLWRNQTLQSLRTPHLLTEQDQSSFLEKYDPYIHRYWLIKDGDKLIGMGGITNIQWENRLGEISLIIGPGDTRKGVGGKAADLLLREAFGNMGLKTVFGECYMCNEAWKFWRKKKETHSGMETILPNRKLWEGVFYDSYYFSIDADAFVF